MGRKSSYLAWLAQHPHKDGRDRGAGMSKLFKLREWLTIPEAAKRMSISFGEEVTEADVFRLALDGHLRLSVNFVNHAKARCGKPTAIEDGEWFEFPAELVATLPGIPEEARGKPLRYMSGLNIDGERCLSLSDDVTTLRGVWDLPMIGGEQSDLEHEFQMLTGGPAITLTCLEGAFVEGPDGTLCQLQESFESNPHEPGSLAALTLLESYIREEAIAPQEADELLRIHAGFRKKFRDRAASRPAKENYYPAPSLPDDAVLVVRSTALREFEESVNAAEAVPARQSTPRDSSLIGTLAALLAAWPGGVKKIPSERELENAAELVGIRVSNTTIGKVLKMAKEAAPSLNPTK